MKGEKPQFPPSICLSCRHMGETLTTHHRNHYVACYVPVAIPAVLRMNGFNDNEWDRMIPRHELLGYSDSSRYNGCATFERILPKPDAPAQDGAQASDGPADPRLVALLKPFRAEAPS